MEDRLRIDLNTISYTLALSASFVLVHGIFSTGLQDVSNLAKTVFGSNPFVEKNLIYAKMEADVGIVLLSLSFIIQLIQNQLPSLYIFRFTKNIWGRFLVFIIPCLLLLFSFWISVGIANKFGYNEFVEIKFDRWRGIALTCSINYQKNAPNNENEHKTIEKIERLFELDSSGTYEERLANIKRYFKIEKADQPQNQQ